jgi:pimeloyl-ACP methyl ester carboxylesterase
MPAMADALREVASRFGARAAVGHSVGASALALALRRGLPLDAAVLVAPPRAPAAFLEAFCARLGLGAGTRRAVVDRIERRVGLRMAELTVPDFTPALRTPALIVHDRADAEVPWEEGEEIAAAWPGARLLATDGLGHRRILRDARVVAEAAAFVTGHLARCEGCGRLAARVAGGGPRCEGCLLALHLWDREARTPGASA